MTEEVKDFKNGMEEYQAYLNRAEVTEEQEEAFACDTKYERYP